MSSWYGDTKIEVVAVSGKTVIALRDKVQKLADGDGVVAIEVSGMVHVEGASEPWATLAMCTIEIPPADETSQRWRKHG